jgi:2-(1,2-epoxy-1,2-dihydrophenyl)acetyl-CoA isomerase
MTGRPSMRPEPMTSASAGASTAMPPMVDAMRVLADVVLAVHDCPIPVVAKVDGLCVGAGLGLALAADITYCSDRARFCAIFAKRGLSLDFGSSWLLRQRIGAHQAKELAFTAKMVSADEAAELGLVNAVFPAGALDASVDAVVATIAAGPPIALASTKREINNASAMSLAQALEIEALAQSVNVQTEDLREALMAWMEKRPPVFKGR